MIEDSENSKASLPDPDIAKKTPQSEPIPPASENTVSLHHRTYQILNADEALEILRQGKILENGYIQSFQFSSNSQPFSYTQKIIIKNCVFGSLDFSLSSFQQSIQLENVRVEKEFALTANVHFDDAVVFNNCTFEKTANIKGVQFFKGLSTVNSNFEQSLLLENCTFKDDINFSRINVEKKFSLKSCELGDTVRLQSAKINGETSFLSCTFHGSIRGEGFQTSGCFQIKDSNIIGDFALENTTSKARIDLEKDNFRANFRWNTSLFQDKLVVRACTFQQNSTWCNCTFKNHFALPQSRFEAELALDGSIFEDKVFFADAFFEDASWRGITFHDFLDCEKLHLGGQIICQGTIFNGPVNFSFMESLGRGRISFNAVFNKSVDFYRATLRGSVWFLGSHFQDAFFVNTTFEGQVFFSFDTNTLRERNRRSKESPRQQSLTYLARFEGIANFTNALFYRKAVFENIIFEQYANFENAYFAEEINFQKSHFKKGTTFKGSFCTQELDFTKAVFDEYANFDLANINRRLNLTDAAIDQGISFYHAVIDVVVVERDQIEGRLIYEGQVANQADKKHYMRVKEEYLILKESFHQRGKFDEEDWAYYCYRVNDRKSFTDKSVRSLLKKPILAVQDDVPPEERENDQVLADNAQKSLEKAEKALASSQEHIKKIEAQLNELSPNEGKKTRDIQDRLDEAKKKYEENLQTLEIRKKELVDVQKIVTLNAERQKKLHESRDKPFSQIQALSCLFQNMLWKLVDWGTGYGVRPFRLMLLALVVILGFAAIYGVSGAMLPCHNQEMLKQHSKAALVFDWIYFSAMTFATANPEAEISFDEKVQFFIMTESLIGIFLTALFVGCYTRKILR